MSNNPPYKAITTAIAHLTDIVGRINNAGSIMSEVAQEGVVIAKEQMSKYGIPTGGALGESIRASRVDASAASLEADGGHASFVEFGTGIVGKRRPHKEARERWVEYDRNQHGEKGWIYPKDGKFFHTKGQPSRPFWYTTGKVLNALGKRKLMSMLNKGEKG